MALSRAGHSVHLPPLPVQEGELALLRGRPLRGRIRLRSAEGIDRRPSAERGLRLEPEALRCGPFGPWRHQLLDLSHGLQLVRLLQALPEARTAGEPARRSPADVARQQGTQRGHTAGGGRFRQALPRHRADPLRRPARGHDRHARRHARRLRPKPLAPADRGERGAPRHGSS